MQKKAYLVLENGKIFEGAAFGYDAAVIGELVFTTAMTGYLETLTDPSYYGQIVMQTFPLIGNYGFIPHDLESRKPYLTAYIIRDLCQDPSNFRSEGVLDTFLKSNRIPGVSGIDTRELTRIVREYGVMNAAIAYDRNEAEALAKGLCDYRVTGAVNAVGCETESTDKGTDSRFRVVLMDFGAKENIKRELLKRGCDVITVPSDTSAERVVALQPDGIMLSNGPGDPAENTAIITELQNLMKSKIPTFGICLGHQLMALSQGAKTEKLKYGHRGANQPAKELDTGRVYITSQNHGYAVVGDSLPPNAHESFLNANDGTCEGVTYTDMPAFSVQFHPEASAGPLDTGFLFDRFMTLMKTEDSKCR